MSLHYNSLRVKKNVLRALAQQDPEFWVFEEKWRDVLPEAGCPEELAEAVLALAIQDPDAAAMADHYTECEQASGTYAIPGLAEMGVLIAALFLLRTHIKIHKDTEGKWEFLLEHKEMAEEPLEKIAGMLTKLFSSPPGES